MKLLILACLAVAALANPIEPEIDWSKVVPVHELPGFWDGRELQPSSVLSDTSRTGRIVGG
jgi:hypothetical protein